MGGERLSKVMTALARPTRLMRGKEGAGTADDLDKSIMGQEELALLGAYQVAAGKLSEKGAATDIAQFLEAIEV